MLQLIYHFENEKHKIITVYRHNIKDSYHGCFDISVSYTPRENSQFAPSKRFPNQNVFLFEKKSLFTVDIVNFPFNFPVQTLPFASG